MENKKVARSGFPLEKRRGNQLLLRSLVPMELKDMSRFDPNQMQEDFNKRHEVSPSSSPQLQLVPRNTDNQRHKVSPKCCFLSKD